jgi:hypothetical protein
MIGISGLARSGKDTLAKYLSEVILEDIGIRPSIYSFADKIKWQLKDIINDQYGISPYTEDTEEKKIIRDILVCHGETMKKVHGKTIWADLMFKNLNKGKTKYFPIIPDVRFDFEVKYIQKKGGQVIHISKIGNIPPNKIEEENDPLCKNCADIQHTWGVYAPDQMHNCKNHALILWQILKEGNEEEWKKIYC